MLGIGVVLFLQITRLAPAFSGKHRIIYTILSGILTAGIAFGIIYLMDNEALMPVYWLLCILFLVAGAVHFVMNHERYFKPRPGDAKIVAGEYLFAISVSLFSMTIFSALVYFVKDEKGFLFFPVLLSNVMFLMPLLFMHTFSSAFNIPDTAYSFWRYPAQPIDPPEPKENERLLVIGFEIAKQKQDTRKTYFRARALEDIRLGEMYYHFLEDYNELQSETPIQYRETNNQLQQWWFHTKAKWYQRSRILDPMLDMKENKIKENTVIICERIA